jgi:hypothetical protein
MLRATAALWLGEGTAPIGDDTTLPKQNKCSVRGNAAAL